jgi:hypothetical protein
MIKDPTTIPNDAGKGNGARRMPLDIIAQLWNEGKSLRCILQVINKDRSDPFRAESLEKRITKARKSGDNRFPYRYGRYDPTNR